MKKNLLTLGPLFPGQFKRLHLIFKKWAVLVLLLAVAINSYSRGTSASTEKQTQKVSGQITDALTGEQLPGVSIAVEGTKTGTITDIDGNYSIEISGEDVVLVVSYVGYVTQKISVQRQVSINIKLAPEIKKLDEVVVVGYGTQKRTTVTGSISSVKGGEIAENPVPNISNSLAGRVSGVSMRPKGGQPGKDDPDIHIRGIATTGNNAPLIVVDGVIRNNIDEVDPVSIESVTVLKDAAAVAPYGMGGANGVLLITTKSGKTGAPTLTFNALYGVQTPVNVPNMLSAVDYMTLINDAYYNKLPNGTHPLYEQSYIDSYNKNNALNPDEYPNNNFFKQIANLDVPLQKYNLQVSGGSDKIKYYAGLGYFHEDGMFSNVGYERYTYNVKVETEVTKTTKVLVSLQGAVENSVTTTQDPASIMWFGTGIQPTWPQAPIKYSNGLWGQNSPLGIINSGYDKTTRKSLLSTISIEQELPFIKGLSVKGVFSYDPADSLRKVWQTPNYYYDIDTTSRPYKYTKQTHSTNIQLDEYYRQRTNYTYQGYINYHNTFGKHDITGLFVAEASQTDLSDFMAERQGYVVQVDELFFGSSNKALQANTGGSSMQSTLGYIYRVGYGYAGKYLFETSGRYDGNYTFAPGKKFGYFPAVSAGWRISEESFLKDKFDWLYNLKLRGSWGKSGNLPYYKGLLQENQFLSDYTIAPGAYAFGGTPVAVTGSYIPHLQNVNVTWETSTKTDVGFELGLWKGMITIEGDYFHEDRNNMLLPPVGVVPGEIGLDLPLVNAGKMSNNGVEFSVSSSYKFENGIQVGVNGNFTYAKNKIVQTFEASQTYNSPNRRRTGRQLNTPFGFHALGLFSTADDKNGDGVIDAKDGYNVNQFNLKLYPGDIKYADISGPNGVPDGLIDQYDETVIGYPTYPAITYGFAPNVSWKGFELSLFFQGAAQASLSIGNFQTEPFMNSSSNTSYEYFNNFWTPTHQNAKYPRPLNPQSTNNTKGSDFYMMNTGYLRLKNAVLGYRLPVKALNFLKIQSVRIFVTGQNLLTFSKLKFMDPEEADVDASKTSYYPNQKEYTMGLDVTF